MSFSDTKSAAVWSSAVTFLEASRTASLRLALEPPPFSTALVAALIRRSLSRAKSDGVRICLWVWSVTYT
jgi:hypothetical protein